MTIHANKTVWITGAGKGIGRALALHMARQGWQVAASARTVSDLTSLEAEGPAGHIHPFPLDVCDAQATRATLAAIEKAMGPLSLTVLNAGTHVPMGAADFSADTVRHLLEVNVLGTANGLDALIPLFRERRSGHIAVVASVAGYRGLPNAAAYGASKAALINMCEALYPELLRDNVMLSLVNPGFVDTPLTQKNDFPMPMLITAEEAAKTIYKGLTQNKYEIVFPRVFALIMKLLRWLPNKMLFSVTKRMLRHE